MKLEILSLKIVNNLGFASHKVTKQKPIVSRHEKRMSKENEL